MVGSRQEKLSLYRETTVYKKKSDRGTSGKAMRNDSMIYVVSFENERHSAKGRRGDNDLRFLPNQRSLIQIKKGIGRTCGRLHTRLANP